MGNRVKEATSQVIFVGALTMGFQRMLGLVCSKYVSAGPHGCEGSAISVSSLGAFWSAVARAVWPEKLLVTNTTALLGLLGGSCGSDPAFFLLFGVVFAKCVATWHTC